MRQIQIGSTKETVVEQVRWSGEKSPKEGRQGADEPGGDTALGSNQVSQPSLSIGLDRPEIPLAGSCRPGFSQAISAHLEPHLMAGFGVARRPCAEHHPETLGRLGS